MPLTITVQKEVEVEHVPSDAEFMVWAVATEQDPSKSIELNIRVVNKAEIQSLNKLYRAKDKFTNVLSFTSVLPEGVPDKQVLADVLICAEVVKEEAEKFNKSLRERWAHMVVHACLHVQGFDHAAEDEREFMEAEERKILRKLQFSDPYRV